MDPTCGLVDKFRDLLLNLIWEQLLYLFHYHRNIEQLNENLGELIDERSSMQHRIDEATNNVEQIEDKVLRWLHKVDQISEQAQQFRDEESQARTECSITSCPNPWLRYRLSKRAKAMSQEVVDICGKGNFNTISYRIPPQWKPELTNRESNEGIDSRVPIMNQIMEALQNPSVNMIGLCGLGGVGKTTIAKEVAKKANNQNMFEKVIMAIVSDELSVDSIQRQIAEKLGMQLNEETEVMRASRLCGRLKNEENMLLILDDLWKELDLGKVGIPFAVENYSRKNEGCKILLTSRNEELLSNSMKCQKVIKVGVLLENEALELFKRNAELSVDSSNPNLISIASEIVQECGGLPLAIATAAKALRGKKPDEWKDYLARWKNHLRRNNTGIKEVDASLKMSYDNLSLEKKHIFLLVAMLSHDPSIEDLLIYSLGLDILEGVENMEEAHTGISTIISKLKSLNLFLDGLSSYHVTIHDVFRDVALSVASNELHAYIVRHKSLKEWPDENKLEGYKGICLQESDISDFPEELHGPRLEFFLLNSSKHDLTIPNMFFKSSKNLKVLAFTNMHFSSLPLLRFLQKLKALCLHSCSLEDITEVRSLKNLKALSLAYSDIQQLPIELAELTSLQMLNLTHCSKLKVIPPKLLSSFKKLEVLYMGNSFDQWKVEGSSEANENACLEDLKDLPISSLDIHIPDISIFPENLFLDMNLKRYRILMGKHWKWQQSYGSSKILKLELGSSIHLQHGIRKLWEEVEDLHLNGSDGLESVFYNHGGGGFPHLRHLQIENNDDIKYVVLNSAYHQGLNAIVFHELRTLKMNNLQALTADLCIKDRATNNKCKNIFKSLFNKVLFPKLEMLELFHLNYSISMIWDDQLSSNSFSNLKTLIVKGCGFVKLVSLHVLKSLNNLEELEASDCDKLEMVFDFEDLNDHKEMESLSVVVPLKKLVLRYLPNLKNVWSNHYNQGINVSLPSLRSMDVSSCGSLTSMFPVSMAKVMLRNLEELRISDCNIDAIVAKDQVLESVHVAFEFPKLTSLELSRLPYLKNFYPERHTLECPYLQQLSIRYCDELEIFEKGVSSSSEIHEEEITQDLKYPLLSHKVIGNLEELTFWGKAADMIVSGQFPMDHLPKVRQIDLEVPKTTAISSISLLKSFPNLENLALSGGHMYFDVHDGAALDAIFSRLDLFDIPHINLTPFLVSSPNLTQLFITDCHELTYLMTPSIARSLVHLASLSIGTCDELQEIIGQEGEDDESKEIFFHSLKYLELDELRRLQRFCSHSFTLRFPLLKKVNIMECPRFKSFSSGLIDMPSLGSAQLLLQDWVKHQKFWDPNLNKAIHQQRFASRELVLDESDVSMIRNDQFPAHPCPEVEILRIEGFVEGVTFPCALLERFPQLKELHVQHSSFEEIFPSNNAHIVHQIPPFKQLHIANLGQLKNIWRDDSQKQPPIQNQEIIDMESCSNLIKMAPSFANLTQLKVSKCHQLIYLVTNSVAKILVNLETLEINHCEKMEEIIMNETSEDGEGRFMFNGLRILKLTDLLRLKTDFSIENRAANTRCRNIFKSLFSHNKVLLPKLEILELSNLNHLIPLIWKDQLAHNSYNNLKSLIVKSCGFLKLVPFHVLKSLNNLEVLEVQYCDMLEIVFDLEDLNDYTEMEPSSLVAPMKKLILWTLPKLKNVWGNHREGAITVAPTLVSSPNLTHLELKNCRGLTTTLMTSSTARSLVHLTRLSIVHCDQIEEIIMKKGEDDEDKEIFFAKLEILELDKLPRLRRFCNHNYTFKFPLLECVTIRECPRLTMFCPGAIYAPQLQRVRMNQYDDIWTTNLNNTIRHQFTTEEVISTIKTMVLNAKNITMIVDVFPRVYTLYVESFPDEMVTFPYSSLVRFPQLDQLYVEHSSFKEIFPSRDQIIDFTGEIPSFTELYITHLDQLKSIWNNDSQLPPIHQDLRFLKVKSCCNLVKLAPSSASFENLASLSVSRCHQLIYLVTSSTAKSLVSLGWLKIDDCKRMKQIVMNETNEDVEGGITFNQLCAIKLTEMPSLKMFSSGSHTFEFPELIEANITSCPQMKMFCPGVLETPKLSEVKIEEHEMEWNDKGDLNKVIEMLSSAKDSVNV